MAIGERMQRQFLKEHVKKRLGCIQHVFEVGVRCPRRKASLTEKLPQHRARVYYLLPALWPQLHRALGRLTCSD